MYANKTISAEIAILETVKQYANKTISDEFLKPLKNMQIKLLVMK